MDKKLLDSKVLLHVDHVGCSFWESPKNKILVIVNPRVADLIAQVEEITRDHGYQLLGNVQLIRRDDGEFNGTATLVKKNHEPIVHID